MKLIEVTSESTFGESIEMGTGSPTGLAQAGKAEMAAKGWGMALLINTGSNRVVRIIRFTGRGKLGYEMLRPDGKYIDQKACALWEQRYRAQA